jgi:hypothetical protein
MSFGCVRVGRIITLMKVSVHWFLTLFIPTKQARRIDLYLYIFLQDKYHMSWLTHSLRISSDKVRAKKKISSLQCDQQNKLDALPQNIKNRIAIFNLSLTATLYSVPKLTKVRC